MVEYTCEVCEFQTNLKKNYQRHLKTQKHIKAVGQTPPLEPTPEPPVENIVEPTPEPDEENIVEEPVEEERSDLEKPKRTKRKSYNSETALMKELEKQAQEEKQAVKKAPKKKKKKKIIEVVEEESSSEEEIIERRVIRKKKPAPRVSYEDDYREPTPIQPPPRLRRL